MATGDVTTAEFTVNVTDDADDDTVITSPGFLNGVFTTALYDDGDIDFNYQLITGNTVFVNDSNPAVKARYFGQMLISGVSKA